MDNNRMKYQLLLAVLMVNGFCINDSFSYESAALSVNASEEVHNFINIQLLKDIGKGTVFSKEGWVKSDLTSEYYWIKKGKVFLFYKSGHVSMVYYDNDNEYVVINRGDGYLKLNEFLEEHFSCFPSNKAERKKVLSTIIELVHDTRGYIGSRRLYQSQKRQPFKAQWMQGSVKDFSVYEKYCDDPVLLVEDVLNKWSYSLYYFNVKGSVDRIDIIGVIEPFRIDKVNKTEILKERSFSFPDEF